MTSDAQVLAAALGLDDSTDLSRKLETIGGVGTLWYAGAEALSGVLDGAAVSRLDAFLELCERRLLKETPPMIDNAGAVATYLRPRLALHAKESFWVLMLDSRGRVVASERVAEGTLTSCLVHPREVFAAAIRVRAAHIVLAHNHPSGDPSPSPEDIELTERMAEAGRILGIPVVDHVIIAREGYRSVMPSKAHRDFLAADGERI